MRWNIALTENTYITGKKDLQKKWMGIFVYIQVLMTVNSRHAVETRYPFYSQIPFSFIFFANMLQWKKVWRTSDEEKRIFKHCITSVALYIGSYCCCCKITQTRELWEYINYDTFRFVSIRVTRIFSLPRISILSGNVHRHAI